MDYLFHTKAWLTYQLKAHYRRGHHVHSPYTYMLFTNVLFEKWQYYSFQKIESIRKRIGGRERAADKAKYTQLLQRLCATNSARNIVEMGRSNGISTMYLAANDSRATVYSFGDWSKNKIFEVSGYKNIRQYGSGEMEEKIKEVNSIDMLVVKNNKSGVKIDKLFEEMKTKSREGSIFVFEEIHKDKETEEQWKKILKSQDITLSIDIFQMGIVWFRSEIKRQHYIVKY